MGNSEEQAMNKTGGKTKNDIEEGMSLAIGKVMNIGIEKAIEKEMVWSRRGYIDLID